MYRGGARTHGDRLLAIAFVFLVTASLAGLSSIDTGTVFTNNSVNPSNNGNSLLVQPPASQSNPVSAIAGQVQLAWTASPTAPGAGHTLDYIVLRGPLGGPYSQIGTTATLAYNDTPPADGTYEYVIQARVNGGGSFTSANSAAKSGISDRTAPVATAALPAASDVTQLTVSVNYTDGGVGVTSISLYVKPPAAGGYSLVSTQSFAASLSGTKTFAYTAAAGVGNYLFYALGTDAVGNVQAVPGAAQLTTLFDPTLTFKRTTNNNSPDLDMNPNYAPAGADTTCTLGASGCTWTAPAYAAGQGFGGPSSTATVYLENTAGVPPTLRAVTSSSTGNATSAICGFNSPWWAGDVVICAMSFAGGTGTTVTDPCCTQMTRIQRTDAGTTVGTVWYYFVLTSSCNGACSGGGGYTVTFGSKSRFTSVSLLYSGVDTTSPIVANGGLADAACCSTSHTAPTISTGTVTNTMIVTMHAVGAISTWTPPTGAYGTMVEERDLQAPTSGAGTQVASETNDLAQSAAGLTGTRTATSATSAFGASQILALRPLPATCTVTVALLKNGVSFASNTASITTGSIVSTPVTISHGAVSFATGDKLSVAVTQPVSSSCAVKVHYDGAGVVSKLVHPQ